jgi:hypothetical protein
MLSTPFEFQIVFTPKPMYHTESTTLVLSPQKFPRTAVNFLEHLAARFEALLFPAYICCESGTR